MELAAHAPSRLRSTFLLPVESLQCSILKTGGIGSAKNVSPKVLQPLRFRSTNFTSVIVRSAAATPSVDDLGESIEPKSTFGTFGNERPLTPLQEALKNLSTPARYAACFALFAIGGSVGSAIGARLRVLTPPIGQIAGGTVLGAAGAAAAYFLNVQGKQIAAVELHNALARLPDPMQLKKEDVKAIAERFGVSIQDPSFVAEMKDVYDRFISATIPPGNDELSGEEADIIGRFKNSLGLEDDDAAAVHIEIGRRIFRQRLETGDKEQAVEERRTFQKLVYVSSLVFGDKSKFLLPWKRIFRVSDAQVELAVKDNAQRLFEHKLKGFNASTDVDALRELRSFQLKCKLPDDIASELFTAKAREVANEFVRRALEAVKARSRTKDVTKALADLDALRAFNLSLSRIAAEFHEKKGEIVPGVGPVIVGAVDDGDRQMDDLKLLYQTYLGEALSNSVALQDSTISALSDLRNVFGLGTKEAEKVSVEVTSKEYRRRLAAAVKGGELEKAESKAEFLQQLCDDIDFDPELAAAIHEEIYRQKLEICLKDNSLSDDDVAALQRLRVMLCVPREAVDKAHADVCGRIFTKVVDDAISAGVDGYDGDMKERVKNAAKGLRLPPAAVFDIAAKAVKSIFLTYIKRARGGMSRLESARELKKMVLFSNLTVSQLLDDIKGGYASLNDQTQLPSGPKSEEDLIKEALAAAESAAAAPSPAAAPAPEAEPEQYDDEVASLQSLRKTRGPAREGKAQKEINVADVLELRERTDLYRTYLLYCLQGESAGMPMGTQITVQKDENEFIRLAQLGDVLGLTPSEVASVHQGLAEQAFKSQAQTLLADGQLSKTRAEQLKVMQRQLGLNDESAQKIVQGITSSKMAGAIDKAVQQGKLSLSDIQELKQSGVNIESMVSASVRTTMFRKLVEQALGNGKAQVDSVALLETLPEDLSLDREKMRTLAREIAGEKLKASLVQAVALLRQKKTNEVAAMVCNILACDKLKPADGPLSWAVKEELFDLYSIHVNNSLENPAVANDADKFRLRELLAIDGAVAESLEEVVKTGGFSLEGSNAEESFVF